MYKTKEYKTNKQEIKIQIMRKSGHERKWSGNVSLDWVSFRVDYFLLASHSSELNPPGSSLLILFIVVPRDSLRDYDCVTAHALKYLECLCKLLLGPPWAIIMNWQLKR